MCAWGGVVGSEGKMCRFLVKKHRQVTDMMISLEVTDMMISLEVTDMMISLDDTYQGVRR